MVVSVLTLLRNKTYETQVVLLTAFLATLRLFLALYVDTHRAAPSSTEILTDVALLVVFGSLLILGLRQANFRSVHPIFGLLIIFLLGLNFIEFQGVKGTSRFNYYSGIYVIVLIYSGRWLYGLLVFQFLFLVFLSASTFLELSWPRFFFLDFQPEPTDFLFALLALGLLSFYFKNITLREIEKFENFSEELRLKVIRAKELNHTLVVQGKALQQAQEHLEEEVLRRTKALEGQQMAIEKYIKLNTTVLQSPMEELNWELDEMKSNEPLVAMLQVSREELNVVFKGIKETLEAQEELNRTKIRPA